MRQIGELWCGADFIWINQRYCLLEINPEDAEAIAVRIRYDDETATGNTVVNFNLNTEVEYCKRGIKNER